MTKCENLANVKHIFLVLSGKGGVGKSTIATQLALGLVQQGKKVGLLDVDICGPSVPHMLNLTGQDIHQCSEGWVPVYTDDTQMLAVVSIGFLLKSTSDAVVWRGPKKNAMIKQFITDVYWKDVEYLIIDTPPGTSDEHITTVETLQSLNPDGAVIVSTPQNIAIADVRREITFCRKTNMPILGIIENMSGFSCPNCNECTNIFSSGGGEALAKHAGVPFLGCVPFDPVLTKKLERGDTSIAEADSPSQTQISAIISKLMAQVNSSMEVE